MGIDVEFAQLATTATFRNGLYTIVEGGIDTITPVQLTDVAQLTLVVRLTFTEDALGQVYSASAKVVNPRGEDVSVFSLVVPAFRPGDGDADLPYTFFGICPVGFVPSMAGVFTVRFEVQGSVAAGVCLLKVKQVGG